MSFFDFLPHYILLVIELAATIFALTLITWWLWEWLMGSEIEDKRIMKNG